MLGECWIFPLPRGRETNNSPLYSPTYSPCWPGVQPLGQGDDMCIRLDSFLLYRSKLNPELSDMTFFASWVIRSLFNQKPLKHFIEALNCIIQPSAKAYQFYTNSELLMILQQVISHHILITVIWKSLLNNSKKVRACALVSMFIKPPCFLLAWGSVQNMVPSPWTTPY